MSIKRFTREENERVMPVLREEARVRARILGEDYLTQLEVILDFYILEGGAGMTAVEVILDSKEDRDQLLHRHEEHLNENDGWEHANGRH